MPKVTLTFTLPEELEEFDLAHKGAALKGQVEDFDSWLRGKIKYENLPEAEYSIYQYVRDKLWECIGG